MAPTITLVYRWADRDGGLADNQVHIPFSSASNADALAQLFAARMQAISDAVLISYRIEYKFATVNPPLPPASSDVLRTGLFVIRLVDNNMGLIALPSVREDLRMIDAQGRVLPVFDTGQPTFDGFRNSLTGTCDKYGYLFAELVTGGLAL